MNKAHRTLWLGFCFLVNQYFYLYHPLPVVHLPALLLLLVNTLLQFRTILPFTPAYEEMVALRMKVLLEPIGVPPSYINPEKEAGDSLVGAYMDNILVGCCILTAINEATVQLRQMAVAADLQAKGVGRQILYFAEGLAREKGYKLLLMHARDNVVPFYRKCGYIISGELFFEVGIPHRKMQKNLRAENGQIVAGKEGCKRQDKAS